MLEDRPLESLQRFAGLEPLFFVQPLARVAVHGERFDLPTAAVEREHEQGAEALDQRFLLDQRLQLGDQLAVTSEIEIGCDSVHERGETQLVQALDLEEGERLVR